MRGSSLRQLSDQDALGLYEWAEASSDAVIKCTCQQVRRLKTLPELSHALGGQTLFLHYETPALVAEVCGMVVGITPKEDQVSYEVDDGTSVLRIVETRKSLRQAGTRSNQAGVTTAAPCGIPDCYIMPPQPQPSVSTSRLANGATNTYLAPLIPRFKVADVVECIGKVQIDRSGQRFLVAQRMARCDDINMESHHQINVVKLEIDVYRQPFEWSRLGPETKEPSAKHSTRPRIMPKDSARLLVSQLSPNDNAVAAPMIQADSDHQIPTERQRLSRDEARRLISGSAPFSTPSLLSASLSCSLRTGEHTQSSRATESYFQLQLQQHISQHYRCHAFALSDLCTDSDLSSLAQRLVSIRLQRRQASRSADTSHTRTASLDTAEQQPEKVRRLFEWAIRKMMHDGFIILAESDDSRLLTATRKTDPGSTDVYRLVTPEYLLHPLNKLLGNSHGFASPRDPASHDPDELAARLRILDDRFRNISSSLVQDSLALYYARRAPIVID
ncbi:uncharacterized protein SRS1_12656 [Sporisorium reilianum f. sp. reilianum]|uniref:CST complex subunit STN1 n=1 Tax=Sporisorium reilianum f. sp. reilianum TaxID=72559 RepID=A0A2N8UAF1_9BASI|nr:uncharacterized protein SRS1_12656 [Sporisorium reilianum f. sp. reilianum]